MQWTPYDSMARATVLRRASGSHAITPWCICTATVAFESEGCGWRLLSASVIR
jgi:hypothetical protein